MSHKNIIVNITLFLIIVFIVLFLIICNIFLFPIIGKTILTIVGERELMSKKEIRVAINTPLALPDEYLHLRYDLITTIVYSKVFINVDGSLTKSHQYNPGPIVEYAHSKGVKIVLMFVVNNSDPGVTDVILGNITVRNIVINNLLKEVVDNDFDGISNDIENINKVNTVTGTSNRDLLTGFQAQISKIFWGKNPNYDISMWISFVNWNDLVDITGLDNYTNYFHVMEYGFSSNRTLAGPWAPMNDSSLPSYVPKGILPSLDYWYGLGLDKNKTIIGIAYEGEEYPTIDDSRLSKIAGPTKWAIYDVVMPNISQYKRIWDEEWKTPYFVRQINGQWYQTHIDDIQSLRIKYDMVNSEGLAGIAIWSIEEGTDMKELWEIIQENLAIYNVCSNGEKIWHVNNTFVEIVCGAQLATRDIITEKFIGK